MPGTSFLSITLIDLYESATISFSQRLTAGNLTDVSTTFINLHVSATLSVLQRLTTDNSTDGTDPPVGTLFDVTKRQTVVVELFDGTV